MNNKLEELEKIVGEARNLLLDSAGPFDKACLLIGELEGDIMELKAAQVEEEEWPQVGKSICRIFGDGSIGYERWEGTDYQIGALELGMIHKSTASAWNG